jgi:hypothetical protein
MGVEYQRLRRKRRMDRVDEEVVAFRPSDEARRRVAELVAREEEGALTPEESSELEQYIQLEHRMRIAKARART